MSDFIIVVLSSIIAVRTFSYGIKTFEDKNVLGGIFVLFLSFSILSLSSYLLFFNRT